QSSPWCCSTPKHLLNMVEKRDCEMKECCNQPWRVRGICFFIRMFLIWQCSAAYAFGIARNHPFIDCNKRAALLTIGLFLEKNGFELEVSKIAATQVILQLAAGELDEKALANWISEHMKRKKSA